MSPAYESITARILDMLSHGQIPWRRPWRAIKGLGMQHPRNISGNLYRGANWFLLGMLSYPNPIFLTYRQAQALGGHIRKGEHGFPVVFWKLLEITEDTATEADQVGRKIPFAKTYIVFNVSQCEGLSLVLPEALPVTAEFDPIQDAEALWEGMPHRPELHYGGDRACYIPGLDLVKLPDRKAFGTPEGYYETLFHEAGHATGHASRLNRKELMSGSHFGGRDYSMEELVAELCAAFLCAEVGIDQAVIENQTAYLQGWLEKLQKDQSAFVTAAARAQKAADFILGRRMQGVGEEEAA
ncbi:ArdC family protein [Geothrix fuzhouensis]|uniref:ArdC family protein n=1 Tax=Geothrix fuzhouensis TaxID=2966451 RepID=UPI0021487B4C|nr:zincin-like metallopeptidase domain-containing protein [Geothrix fuzhouensis]